MAEKDSFALSHLLLCHESESSLNESDEQETTSTVEDDEFITNLVLKENLKENQELIKTTSSSLDRLIAIDWILTTRTRFDFQHQTAYIAISYFDLFLKKRFIVQKDETWAIKLLSVACLSLAAKMEERNVPGLSQYPQDQDFVFKPDVIRKTELMILTTLGWKMNIITPFHYFNYFITKISNHSVSRDLVLLRSSESLLALTKEISFTDYRQFVVAAATTLLALDMKLTKEEIMEKFGSFSWWTVNENDNVYSCCERMREIEERKHMTPPPVSRDIEHAVASGSSAKRRLSFDDPDQKRMRRL